MHESRLPSKLSATDATATSSPQVPDAVTVPLRTFPVVGDDTVIVVSKDAAGAESVYQYLKELGG